MEWHVWRSRRHHAGHREGGVLHFLRLGEAAGVPPLPLQVHGPLRLRGPRQDPGQGQALLRLPLGEAEDGGRGDPLLPQGRRGSRQERRRRGHRVHHRRGRRHGHVPGRGGPPVGDRRGPGRLRRDPQGHRRVPSGPREEVRQDRRPGARTHVPLQAGGRGREPHDGGGPVLSRGLISRAACRRTPMRRRACGPRRSRPR